MAFLDGERHPALDYAPPQLRSALGGRVKSGEIDPHHPRQLRRRATSRTS